MASERRLIDANDITYYDNIETYMDGTNRNNPIAYKEDIDEIPTVDAVEVIHGRWHRCGEECFVCSVCHDNFMIDYNYCPNCGAKMDGGNEDG